MNYNVNTTPTGAEGQEKYEAIRIRIDIQLLIDRYNQLAKKYELPPIRVIKTRINSVSPMTNMDGVGYIGKKGE